MANSSGGDAERRVRLHDGLSGRLSHRQYLVACQRHVVHILRVPLNNADQFVVVRATHSFATIAADFLLGM